MRRPQEGDTVVWARNSEHGEGVRSIHWQDRGRVESINGDECEVVFEGDPMPYWVKWWDLDVVEEAKAG